MNLRRIVAVLFLLVVSSCAPVVGNNRVALIIGIGAYRGDIPPLPNPERDAKALAAMTQKLGYRSLLVLDPTREEMRQALNAFVAAAKTADMALVFYSGHGFEVNGQNMLVPVDFQLTGQDAVEDRAFPLAELDAAFSSIKGTSLLFIDACRDDPFKAVINSPRTAVLQSRGGLVALRHSKGLAQQDARYATAMMYATGPGKVAQDGTGETSPFATAILQNMSRSGKQLRLLLGDIQLSVSAQTNGAQVPSWNTHFVLPATPLYVSKRGANDTMGSPFRMVTAAHPAAQGTVSTNSEILFPGINVTTADPVALSGAGCRTKKTRDFVSGPGQIYVSMEMKSRPTPCTVQFYSGTFALLAAIDVQISREPRKGTVTVLGNAVGYVPEAGFIGNDIFELDLSYPRWRRHAIVNVKVR